jgi:hypothetical protein
MRVRDIVGVVGVLTAVGVLLLPPTATAQWGRGRMMGGGYGMEGRYGGGYQGAEAPYGGGYPQAGYGAPPGGYAPSAYGSGYPPPYGYPPPAYQQPYAYPPPGANPQQASANQMQCQEWATTQSGYNPNAPTQGTGTAQSAMAGTGSVVRGGARGAAVGATAGAIAGNTSYPSEAKKAALNRPTGCTRDSA